MGSVMIRLIWSIVLGTFFWLPTICMAAVQGEYTIVIKDHKFEPEQLTIPANQKVKLVIDNQDSPPEEFESNDLKREKIIQGNSQGTVMVGPLTPGAYHFVGEFHEDTAKGVMIVEQKEE